jgi:hypothetical protein
MLPARESFTGASNTGQFVGNFSKQIPYCLRTKTVKVRKPYAMLFKPGSVKKGSVELYAAKTGTLFCDREGVQKHWTRDSGKSKRSRARARWCFRSPPTSIRSTPASPTSSAKSAKIAFIEPSKGTPGVRPGKLYQAGAKNLRLSVSLQQERRPIQCAAPLAM